MGETGRGPPPHLGRPLPHTAGEHEHVEPTQAGGHRGDTARETVHVDVECQLGGIVLAVEHLPHVGRARQPEQARAVLQRIGDLVWGQALVLLQPRDQPGIDRPAAGGHDEPVEWGETHRGVDTAPVEHRGERRARPEVTGDDAVGARRQLRGSPSRPRVGKPVEAVAAHAPEFTPRLRQRVGVGLGRQGRVERRVEARDVRHVGQQPPGRLQTTQRLRLVQRRQVDQLAQPPLDVSVDHHGLDEVRPAMHDAVPDGVHHRRDGRQAVAGFHRLAVLDDVDLQRARARVDDEDTHAPTAPRGARSSRRSRVRPRRGPGCRRAP